MSVQPGFGGQSFIEDTLTKILELHIEYPQLQIQVDGGVNQQNSKQIVNSGATHLVCGSYLMKSTNKLQAIADL